MIRAVLTSRSAISGLIRLAGAVLTALGAVVGVRVLGAEQFGLSVLAMAVGAILALPLVAMDRLAIRLAAVGREHELARLLRSVNQGSACIAVAGVIATFGLSRYDTSWAFLSAASTATATMTGLVAVRQGVSRARGHFLWGQIPNEVFRPAMTLVGYFIAARVIDSEMQGYVATLFASLTTLVLVLCSRTHRAHPSPLDAEGERPMLRAAVSGLIVITLVSAVVERGYPILIGSYGTADEVAVFTVVMRIVQVGLFGQALAIFVYTPAIARCILSLSENPQTLTRLTRRIRLLSFAVSGPVMLACLVFSDSIESVFSDGLELTIPLMWGALALAAHTATGPSMAVLTMAGHETAVAVSVSLPCFIGAAVLLAVDPGSASTALACVASIYAMWCIPLLALSRRKCGILI